jgi:transposase
MHNGGFSHRRVANHFRVNHFIILRLMQRFRQTGNVTDRPRADRPRKTMPREDRLISRQALSQIEHGDDVMSTVDVLWVVTLAFSDGGGV